MIVCYDYNHHSTQSAYIHKYSISVYLLVQVCADTEYTIHTNVSMIQAPPSWKVYLVDNAGFGEAGQEGIIKQANTALVTSSAYVYVMTYESLGDSKDVAAFQRIYDKDRGQTEILCTTLHFTLLPQLPFFFMHVNSWEEKHRKHDII